MTHWEDYNEEVLADSFDRFMELRGFEKETIQKCLTKELSEIHLDLENEKDFFIAMLSVATMSYALKSIAEHMIVAITEKHNLDK